MEVFKVYDVFVLFSFVEGVFVVLMEVMVVVCFVIMMWIVGVLELVEDGVFGILVFSGDMDVLEMVVSFVL